LKHTTTQEQKGDTKFYITQKQNKTKFKEFSFKQTKDNKNIEIEECTNREKIKN
jgi:hypothetical protein